MRNWAFLVLLSVVIIVLCGCSAICVSDQEPAQLRFHYADQAIDVTLSSQETISIAKILNGKSTLSDSPSCGFSTDISISIDGSTFCLARDTCAIIYDSDSRGYIHLSQEERYQLEKIFIAHGGYFPCI